MLRLSLPAKPPAEWCRVVIDTREQQPLDLAPLPAARGTCDVGDYQLLEYPNEVAVERKSLPDLVACCGTGRDRFSRQVLRLMGCESKMLMVEASWQEVEMGQWRSRVTPNAVRNSLLGWMANGLPVTLAGDRAEASILTREFLYLAWRRRYQRARNTIKNMEETE